jgi:signal transduction histidine kinase/ActR/RegA family two-component response regulator
MNVPKAARDCALGLVVTAAALALTWSTWPFFAPTPFAPLFGGVVFATYFGSGACGLLAIAFGAAGALATVPSTGPHNINAITTIGFIFVSFVGNRLIASQRGATKALRASEAQLRATLEDLRTSEARVQRAQQVEAIAQLAAGVAHNFNNLLTVTMGYTDVLLDADSDEPQRRTAVTEIRRATERGALLARQMLAFGRRHDPKLARVSVDPTILALQDMLTSVVREDITLSVTAQSGVTVLIDPHDLEQIVLNLVINSRDALPGGGAIVVTTAPLTLPSRDVPLDPGSSPGDYACISVRDNGAGMPPEVQAHLFEPFFTTKEVGEGTGLGLAFVHGVARHAGGFVTVDSSPAKGTTVCVYLPIAIASADVVAAEPAAVAPEEHRRATILLVEDEDAVRRLMARTLTRAHYRVLEAASPDEARAIFDRHADEIAVVVTDVVMPEMRGTALAEIFQARRPGLPVLFVSGYSEAVPPATSPAGNVSFLAKPFPASKLLAEVAALTVATRF